MPYIPVTPLRRERKKNVIVINTKTLMYVLLQISICCIILLLPVLSQPFVTHTSTLLSLCILFIFGSVVVGLSIRLLMLLNSWLVSERPAADTIETGRRQRINKQQDLPISIDMASGKKQQLCGG